MSANLRYNDWILNAKHNDFWDKNQFWKLLPIDRNVSLNFIYNF